METLSKVRTIVSIAQDILAAVETARQNKTRCGRVARRVRRLRVVLGVLDGAAEAGTTTDDAAMRSLLEELEEALGRALELVRRCQRAGGFLRALVVAGGRMADPLDEVERDIDRCVQNLGLASYVRIARLEERLRQQNVAETSTDDDSVPDRLPLCRDVETDEEEDDAAAAEHVPAIGVPVCTVVAAGMLKHGQEIVTLPSHGHGHGHGYCYWHHSHGHGIGTCGCWHYYAGCQSDASSYYSQYSPYPYPSIFSDDNPNACSII